MPALTELTLYPIKSCGGISLQEATITNTGLMSNAIHDREWMVVDEQGQFITQRTNPKMAIIVPRINGEVMELCAPGMLPLEIPLAQPDLDRTPTLDARVWRDKVKAYDCGGAAAIWMSKVIDTKCLLVRFHPQANRMANPKWTDGIETPNLFSDSYPFLVISQESLDDLNQKLLATGRDALPMNRFRPNIVIGNVPPYKEDATKLIRAGNSVLQLVRPCQRCPVPSIDQATGTVGPDPQDILKTYHTSEILKGAITFGMHAILQQGVGETLRVGQRIEMSSAP
jgi:uncharacterized protein